MKLTISSEADAWAALERATRGEGFPNDLQIEFKGWPKFEIDFKGKDWDSTVPTRVMSPLLDVQKDINRAYATVRYGEANLRKLRDEERDELEVVVKVKKGSSIFDADLMKQFSQIAEAAVGRMDGNQIVIVVLGLALTLVAAPMWKAWLNSRKEEKEIENRLEMSRQETDRLKLFAEAMKSSPPLKEMQDEVYATHNSLLKAVKTGDSVETKGVTLKGHEVGLIVQPERAQSKETSLEGDFILLGNRTDRTDGFRITVRRISDGLTLSADVLVALPLDQQRLIQRAEWQKKPVWLSISAIALRESYSSAEVVSAQKSTLDASAD